jgi:hypothetical protein
LLRTIEVLFVILILSGAFIAATYLAVLPAPQEVSPINLRRLSFTTLQMLDSDYDLGRVAFETEDAYAWGRLQIALSAALPANVVYNMTVYNVTNTDGQLYNKVASFSNADGIIGTSDVATYTVASSNVTFSYKPEKIGEKSGGGTLYILNCSDANGWWITGYTAQGLAQDLYDLLSPFFANTTMVQNTGELEKILDGQSLHGESVENAVVINTFGEAVPISSKYKTLYPGNSYAQYFYEVGKRVFQYNWTWTSIVGWPFYYVSNTNLFTTSEWGIYGTKSVGTTGLSAFLQGIDNRLTYNSSETSSTSKPKDVFLSSKTIDSSNYYGIYPSARQTSERALPNSITATYNLNVTTYVFNPVGTAIPAAVYRHQVTVNGVNHYQGGFYAIGLTRTPDIRITALGLLADYQPRLYASEYTANGTSRLVVLQLGLAGGS